jgi:hypothetical protein
MARMAGFTMRGDAEWSIDFSRQVIDLVAAVIDLLLCHLDFDRLSGGATILRPADFGVTGSAQIFAPLKTFD